MAVDHPDMEAGPTGGRFVPWDIWFSVQIVQKGLPILGGDRNAS